MNVLKSFFNDHIIKHLDEYESCWKNDEFEKFKTNEDKDRSFLKCHKDWIKDLQQNVNDSLEVRARELFV